MDGSFLALSTLYKYKLETSFPALRNAHQAPQHKKIATVIGIIATQHHDQYEDLRVAMEKKEAAIVEAIFAEGQIQGLLHFTQTWNKAEL